MRIKLLGYAPDADPAISGVITNCTAFVPSTRGMKGAFAPASVNLAALAAKSLGGAVVRKLDDTTRFFAGTQTALYEAGTTTWTDVTRLAGAYTGGAESLWRFTQFGNVTIATNLADTMQYSDASGVFANISGGIKAGIIETVNQFVFAFNTNEATYGVSQDRWWCSGLSDYTVWTPAIATQCATGRLTSSPGTIRAGRRLGNNIVVYKDRSMYVGTYIGPPSIWSFQEISNTVGAPCQEVVIPIIKPDGGAAHIFMGYDDFYYYDGSLPKSIGANQVRETFLSELNRGYSHLNTAMHDFIRGIIYFYYCAGSTGVPNKCLVYNYRTNNWGRDDRSIESAVSYISSGLTYNALGSSYSTYNDLPNVSYNSPLWSSNAPAPAIIDTDHTVMLLSAASVSSDFTTGDIGDETRMLMLKRGRCLYLTPPTTASMTNYYRQNGLADTLSTDAVTSESNLKFDVLREAKWHRAKFNYTGPVELAFVDMELEPSSYE